MKLASIGALKFALKMPRTVENIHLLDHNLISSREVIATNIQV